MAQPSTLGTADTEFTAAGAQLVATADVPAADEDTFGFVLLVNGEPLMVSFDGITQQPLRVNI